MICSTVARKRKTLLLIFPRLFFAIFSLRNISPCYIFHERKRNEVEQVSRKEKRQNEENSGRRGNGKNETKAVRFVKGEMPWVGIRDRCTIFAAASRPPRTFPSAWNTGEIKGREILRGTLTLFLQYIIRERSFSHLLSRD